MFHKSIVVLLLILAVNSLPDICYTYLIESQSCQWYPLCLEAKFQCGQKGYPVGYGYKYCNKFGNLQTYPQARQWIQQTTVCLKQRLSKTLQETVYLTCTQLRNYAFDTHPICYEQAGFCKLWRELGVQNSAVFLRQLLGIFEVKDFQSLSAMKQIEEMVKKCA